MHSDSKSKYSEDDTIKMLECLIDIIFVFFFSCFFLAEKVSSILLAFLGNKWHPLIADIFLHLYEAELNDIQGDFTFN